jgi:hypothetical protein
MRSWFVLVVVSELVRINNTVVKVNNVMRLNWLSVKYFTLKKSYLKQ